MQMTPVEPEKGEGWAASIQDPFLVDKLTDFRDWFGALELGRLETEDIVGIVNEIELARDALGLSDGQGVDELNPYIGSDAFFRQRREARGLDPRGSGRTQEEWESVLSAAEDARDEYVENAKRGRGWAYYVLEDGLVCGFERSNSGGIVDTWVSRITDYEQNDASVGSDRIRDYEAFCLEILSRGGTRVIASETFDLELALTQLVKAEKINLRWELLDDIDIQHDMARLAIRYGGNDRLIDFVRILEPEKREFRTPLEPDGCMVEDAKHSYGIANPESVH
uniref:Uncharacterized protein n=1 Tax=uncultured marine group II/III euryarchaeote KM3_83_G03 TaxID=1456522 RepID=A0A075HXY6_9EURY|nr:hypothetical protein [uncultured marine group II/III euryarchaeote KM3_83_G03]